MSQRRIERVRELLKRSLGEIIRREFPVEKAGLITVNEVNIAADLQSATVFVGVVGNAKQKQGAVTLLEQERKRIQSMMAADVVLRYTPVLRFVQDVSIERGNRVLAILEELEKTLPKEEPKK
ncbi:MAG: 30S ribosome-binding factor RbfA [Verrucomicrobia bacterium]|nr:30S ribosome-binding factor RbfA [Verrucomicrobiota bacterium]